MHGHRAHGRSPQQRDDAPQQNRKSLIHIHTWVPEPAEHFQSSIVPNPEPLRKTQ
jgi:hypothetical protein